MAEAVAPGANVADQVDGKRQRVPAYFTASDELSIFRSTVLKGLRDQIFTFYIQRRHNLEKHDRLV